MMRTLRRILRSGTPGAWLLALGILAVALLTLAPAKPAYACWQTALMECFDQLPTAWPWETSATQEWSIGVGGAAPVTWGINDRVFHPSSPGCPSNAQAAWCMAFEDVGQDPEFDVYGPNWDEWMIWGPLNLATASAGQVSFWLYSRCGVSDSVYWGAFNWTQPGPPQPTTANMRRAGSRYGRTEDWEFQMMDLSRLRNSAGDSVSVVGLQNVYVFWRFRSDPGSNPPANRDMGSFVDNVIVSYDDNQRNLVCQAPSFYRVQSDTSSETIRQARVGDHVFGTFGIQSCNGGLTRYPGFQVTAWLNDTLKVYDTTIVGLPAGSNLTLATDTWVVASTDSHYVKVYVDTLNTVAENRESDNFGQAGFSIVPPNPAPRFVWTVATDDTVKVHYTQQVFRLTWEAYDSAETARSALFIDDDTLGCTGTGITGASSRPEYDGPDALNWNIRSLPLDVPFYLLSRISDADTQICVHSNFPIMKVDTTSSVGDDPAPGVIPEHFFLDQNYPNPFNPQTELRYGLAKAGRVTLKVYNTLGREVATLINGERSPGTYRVNFDGSQLATGVYLYTLTTPEGTFSRKMMLMK